MFLMSMSPRMIARKLTEEGIPTPGGKAKWNDGTIRSILTNEKYKGDALLQKEYTTDFLTKKKKKNEGEVPQYYVKGNHEPIIDPKTFDLVQSMFAARSTTAGRISSSCIYSSKVKCGTCGAWYGAKVWHSNDKYRRIVWQCNHKYKEKKCPSPHVTEEQIKEAFISAANKLIADRDEIIESPRTLTASLIRKNTTSVSGSLLKKARILKCNTQKHQTGLSCDEHAARKSTSFCSTSKGKTCLPNLRMRTGSQWLITSLSKTRITLP